MLCSVARFRIGAGRGVVTPTVRHRRPPTSRLRQLTSGTPITRRKSQQRANLECNRRPIIRSGLSRELKTSTYQRLSILVINDFNELLPSLLAARLREPHATRCHRVKFWWSDGRYGARPQALATVTMPMMISATPAIFWIDSGSAKSTTPAATVRAMPSATKG